MSTPDQTFSDLDETKDFLNIARSNNDSNTKINTSRNAADNYVANQLRLHATIPLTGADPELTSLASQLAAMFFNQFQNPNKREMREMVLAGKKAMQDYIMETYGLKNPNGLSGNRTFGITLGFVKPKPKPSVLTLMEYDDEIIMAYNDGIAMGYEP